VLALASPDPGAAGVIAAGVPLAALLAGTLRSGGAASTPRPGPAPPPAGSAPAAHDGPAPAAGDGPPADDAPMAAPAAPDEDVADPAPAAPDEAIADPAPARPIGPAASTPLLVAAASAVAALAFGLVASVYALEPRPELARVGLGLALLHAGLLGVMPPWHLWALGLARRAPTLGLALAAGLGGLAGLALLGRGLETHPWLLGVVGARPLALGIGLLGLLIAAIAALAEERPARLALQLAGLGAGVGLITLATDPFAWGDAVAPALVDRALALGLALIGADAVARWPSRATLPPAARLLRPAALPLWVGLVGLAGLPPTGGFAARWLELSALWAERPDLVGLSLLGAALGLFGLKRAGDALLGAYGRLEDEPNGAPPPTWRLAAPLVLCGLYLFGRFYPAAGLTPAAMPPL
jgi:hypothetical protein